METDRQTKSMFVSQEPSPAGPLKGGTQGDGTKPHGPGVSRLQGETETIRRKQTPLPPTILDPL